MGELQELARKLLADGAVKVVIGYEEGPRGVRPAFVTRPQDADRLVFDERCVQNLTTYLTPTRKHIAALGKPAIVVKGCDTRSLAGLIRQSQVKRDGVVVIGVRCGGVLKDPTCKAAIAEDTVADRCRGCDIREPRLVDHLVGEPKPEPPGKSLVDQRIDELDAMTPEQRMAFWHEQLARCIRCHACREVCPNCFCVRCVADKSEPIESSAHLRGNLAWHMVRAMHQAGRCVDCGECERACPAGIPLRLLNRKIARVVEARFGHKPDDDPESTAPIGSFRPEDGQEFIR
jgi:formate dehydrogenase (coenzyme F420) beta subunit